jgi:hypothetical protein
LIDHTLRTSSHWHALSRKACSCPGRRHLPIFHNKSKHQFLGPVHVFRHFMRFQKDITDHLHEIFVRIIGEEISGLNDHQLGDESKEGHFCVLMQRLF